MIRYFIFPLEQHWIELKKYILLYMDVDDCGNSLEYDGNGNTIDSLALYWISAFIIKEKSVVDRSRTNLQLDLRVQFMMEENNDIYINSIRKHLTNYLALTDLQKDDIVNIYVQYNYLYIERLT